MLSNVNSITLDRPLAEVHSTNCSIYSKDQLKSTINLNQFKMYINPFNLTNSSSSLDFIFFKKFNCSFLFILIFLLIINMCSASSIPRPEENHDFLCMNHAHDINDCHIYARDKWGSKRDERSLCCFFIEVNECILKKREEYCRGEMMETFRKSHNNEMNHLKTTKCKAFFQGSNCEQEFEIWTLAAMIMLCLISGMACITLGVLYTKK